MHKNAGWSFYDRGFCCGGGGGDMKWSDFGLKLCFCWMLGEIYIFAVIAKNHFTTRLAFFFLFALWFADCCVCVCTCKWNEGAGSQWLGWHLKEPTRWNQATHLTYEFVTNTHIVESGLSICLPVAEHLWLMGLTATAVLGEAKITSHLVRRQTSQEAGRQHDA